MSHPKVDLKIKKLPNFKGELPKYQSSGASGFDVRAQLENSYVILNPGLQIIVPTGLSFEIPPGYELQVRPRSGLAASRMVSVTNTPGTIDKDFSGEILIILINHGIDTVQINNRDRIAQLVLAPVVQANFIEVEELGETDRGSGGFGSTGVK